MSQQVQLAVDITLQSPASLDNRKLAFLKIMTAPRIAGKLMLQSLYPVLLDLPVTCCLHPPCQNHDSDLYKTQIGHVYQTVYKCALPLTKHNPFLLCFRSLSNRINTGSPRSIKSTDSPFKISTGHHVFNMKNDFTSMTLDVHFHLLLVSGEGM
jgi:hypothetical protein